MTRHCYVIASGPSLLGFDFGALPDGARIGANRSAWLANCDMLCTIDRNFHAREATRIAAFGAAAHIGVEDDTHRLPEATYWQHKSTLPGLSFAPNTLAGSNSGFAALNLAVQLDYTDIALLGFDMKWEGARSHFHEGYGQRRHMDKSLAGWALAFETAAQQLKGTGIRVTNFVGPMGSRVRGFPVAALHELL